MIRKAYTVSDKAGDIGHIRRCEFANGAFVEEEIVAWNPGRSFEFFLHKKQRAHIARMQVLSEVAPDKEDTRATITMNYKLALLMRWVPMRRFMQQQAIDHLLGLKYLIEKGQRTDEKTIRLMREAYVNFYSTH